MVVQKTVSERKGGGLMKKSWKIFWIVCGITACIGLVLCVAGVAMGATISDMEANTPSWISFGVDIDDDWDAEDWDEDDEDWERAESPETSEVTSQMVYSGVKEIEVEAKAMELHVLISDDENVSVVIEDEEFSTKVNVRQENEELNIETNNSFKSTDDARTVLLYIPSAQLQAVDIHVDAGAIYIDEIVVNSLDVSVNAGEAVITSFTAKEVDFECGAGRIEATGDVAREIDISCGTGEINLAINGVKDDFNYELECGIGEIIVGDDEFSGLGNKEKRSNGASKEMSIECGIGSIIVDFY